MRAQSIVATAVGIALTMPGAAAAPNQPKTAPAPAAAAAAAKDPASEALSRLALSIQRTTLSNGLRVVLDPDPSAPTVAVAVTYDVGSRAEEAGKSGFAHLFEHMMFQGSANVKKGEHFSLITERGGTLNGTTSSDRTNYFEVLPASELALALWLEADRMRSLVVNAENFENQRAVVKEEYRMRYENAAYARAWLRLGELVFVNYPPYANPTIGKMADLDAAKLEWAQDFYARHYVPNNAVVTVAGGFDPDEALALIERYFGGIPKRAVPPRSPRARRSSIRTRRRRVYSTATSCPRLALPSTTRSSSPRRCSATARARACTSRSCEKERSASKLAPGRGTTAAPISSACRSCSPKRRSSPRSNARSTPSSTPSPRLR
jgi:zinc protease